MATNTEKIPRSIAYAMRACQAAIDEARKRRGKPARPLDVRPILLALSALPRADRLALARLIMLEPDR